MVLALPALFAHRFKFRRDPQGGRGGGDGRDRLDHAPTREERWRGELAATERKKSGPKGPRLHSGGGDGRDRLDHAPTREERWRGELAATERKKSGPKGPRLHSGGRDGRDRLDHVSHTFWYDLIWDPCGLNALRCFR